MTFNIIILQDGAPNPAGGGFDNLTQSDMEDLANCLHKGIAEGEDSETAKSFERLLGEILASI